MVGPGEAEFDALLSWDRPEIAALFGDDGSTIDLLRALLGSFDVAIAYTRSAALVRNLANLIPRVEAHDPTPTGNGSASLWLARPVAALGCDTSLDPPLSVPNEDERRAAQPTLACLPRGFLAIHPGSGSASKNWPAARYAALVEALSPDRAWLLIEGPADSDSVAVLGTLPGAVVIRETARVVGAVLAQAGVYIGSDSGVSHLAAAWGAPTVPLFGPTDPSIWSPLGPKVRTVRGTDGTMDSISVGSASAAARELRDAEGL